MSKNRIRTHLDLNPANPLAMEKRNRELDLTKAAYQDPEIESWQQEWAEKSHLDLTKAFPIKPEDSDWKALGAVGQEEAYILSLEWERREAYADKEIIEAFIAENEKKAKKARKRLKKLYEERNKAEKEKYNRPYWQQRKMAMEVGCDPLTDEEFAKREKLQRKLGEKKK